MKMNWTAEARTRIGKDFGKMVMTYAVQRAAVSDRVLRVYGFSKTQQRKAEEESDVWLRTRLTRLNVLEVVLERRRLIGKLVWWMYDRLTAQMQRPPKMRKGPPAPPATSEEATKGAADGATREGAAQTVPPA